MRYFELIYTVATGREAYFASVEINLRAETLLEAIILGKDAVAKVTNLTATLHSIK